jgi:hypothetical protein
LLRSAENRPQKTAVTRASTNRDRSLFETIKKMQQFPRFARLLTSGLPRKWQFSAIDAQHRRVSYVKRFYFTSVKKRLLQAAPDNLTTEFPGANPRRGQERKTA